MNKEELELRIAELKKEVRSISDSYLDKEQNVEELDKRLAEVKDELEKRTKELAEMNKPEESVVEVRKEDGLFNQETWMKAFNEKRSITIGDNGAVNQIKELFKKIEDKDPVTGKARFYYGANAATNIPVLMPASDPASVAESGTNVSADTAAALSTCEIQPLEYMSIIPVSANALQLNSINLAAELPGIFQDTFARKMHAGMLTGAGTNKQMKGIFVSAAANTAERVTAVSTTGAVTLADLASLAAKVAGKTDDYTIIMNPAVYAKFIADATTGYEVYKQDLIMNKKIEGVDVILDAKAPTFSAAGDCLVAAAPLGRYAIGVAGEIVIDPIKVKGDSNTYFQATLFFSGKAVDDSDCIGYFAASSTT